MATQISYNQIDYSNERTSSKIYVGTIDAASFTAQAAFANAWRAAVAGVSLCNEVSLTASLELHTANGVAPSNVLAQREFIIRVFYKDDVNGRAGSFTVPGPDLSLLTITGDEVSLTTGTEMIALVSATNDMVSRDGNGITVTRAVVNGRNG